MLQTFNIPLTWSELLRRTVKGFSADNALGLAAQLAYYILLALVPALVALIALTSFFPVHVIDQMVQSLGSVAPASVLEIVRSQMQSIAQGEDTGLLTIGFAAALWSSSSAVAAVVDALNRVYDIEEGRPWWRVRLTAIFMTVALAIFIILAFALVMVGPTTAEWLASYVGLGAAFEWSWKILQWPVVLALIATGIGLLYYFGPDAEQDWQWITPGAALATLLWLAASLAFRFYVSNFANYNETYGSLGGVVVLMLWLYISGLAILMGAEMNAEIEYASPHGKEAGEKVPGQKKKLGAAAAREYERRQRERGGVAPDRRERPERRQPAAAAVRPVTRSTRASDWLIGTGAVLAAFWSVLRRQQKVH